MKSNVFHGRYIAQDDDICIETFPYDRKLRAPAMHVIFRRADGKWQQITAAPCSENLDDRYRRGLKLAGTRGSTTYWRKPPR